MIYRNKRHDHLITYGICGPLLNWFQSYLTNRFQTVVIPGGISEWLEILAGVPHGSILGPLLRIMIINYILKEIHSNIRLYADDTSLYIIVLFPESPAQILNLNMERLLYKGSAVASKV